jgi:Ca2+/Na+ antiporter
MATARPNPRSKATQGIKPLEKWPFGRKNYIWFGVSLLVMVIGYVALGQGSTTLAPFLLVTAYCVLVPVAILIKDKPKEDPTAIPTEQQTEQ